SLYHFCFIFFFFNAPATSEIYTLSLHDALPISGFGAGSGAGGGSADLSTGLGFGSGVGGASVSMSASPTFCASGTVSGRCVGRRSEEHTSELQSRENLVCRLLLEKKKKDEQQEE